MVRKRILQKQSWRDLNLLRCLLFFFLWIFFIIRIVFINIHLQESSQHTFDSAFAYMSCLLTHHSKNRQITESYRNSLLPHHHLTQPLHSFSPLQVLPLVLLQLHRKMSFVIINFQKKHKYSAKFRFFQVRLNTICCNGVRNFLFLLWICQKDISIHQQQTQNYGKKQKKKRTKRLYLMTHQKSLLLHPWKHNPLRVKEARKIKFKINYLSFGQHNKKPKRKSINIIKNKTIKDIRCWEFWIQQSRHFLFPSCEKAQTPGRTPNHS